MRTIKPLWLTLALLASLSLALVGCSEQTAKPVPNKSTPQTPSNATKLPTESDKPIENPTPTPKSDDEIQAEIKEKLNRMTHPQGYVLPTDAEQHVTGVSTLAQVSEQLRKKGYSIDLARVLTQQFYQEHATSGSAYVTILATDGYPGAYDPRLEAVFARKNKFAWTITQKHPDDVLNGPNVATYEVEVLKDGSYRLNAWKAENL
ncbi:hypothetical protein [Tumebacillus permanentifrigoris]|uniref:Uncharacterized protein n=1 Tax=Tumebacillus permanentifrigoris TaxID=378543 RepID=A0A316DDC1_9BACL|nr:hypothetical protein [Tumebacillus permanentifrigoris]PWK16004.1 hypothetical protein C7459_102250 [Tumebacillus permanentifrigoris]